MQTTTRQNQHVRRSIHLLMFVVSLQFLELGRVKKKALEAELGKEPLVGARVVSEGKII